MKFNNDNKTVYKSKKYQNSFLKISLITILIISGLFLGFTLPNFLPFFIILPFLIIFYYFNLRSSLKYSLKNCVVNNNVLLIDDGKGNSYKALAILEVENIPMHSNSKQKSFREYNKNDKKDVEFLQYPYTHLTLLNKLIPNLTFELYGSKNQFKIRFLLNDTGNSINLLIEKIMENANVIRNIFQNCFSGIELKFLRGNALKIAWGEVLGGWGNFKFDYATNDSIIIEKNNKLLFLSIFKFDQSPKFQLINNRSQIDTLIKRLFASRIEMSYIISSEPLNECLYLNSRQSLSNSLFQHDIELDKSNISSNKDKIQQELAKIQTNKILGLWNVSAYLVIRSSNKQKLEYDVKRIKEICSEIYNQVPKLLKGRELQSNFSRIPMRSCLNNPFVLSSEQLAIFLHIPKAEIPTNNLKKFPDFEVPPQDPSYEGIPLGKIMFQDQEINTFHLSREDIRLNVLITGQQGMGKTRLVMKLINEFSNIEDKINWICFDWKEEYSQLFNKINKNQAIEFTPGSNYAPLQINMFEPLSSSEDHVSRLFEIIIEFLKDQFNEYELHSSQIKFVIKEALKKTIDDPLKRDYTSFIVELQEIIKDSKIHTSIMVLIVKIFEKIFGGVLSEVFNTEKSNIDFSQILNENVIFNFSVLLSKGANFQELKLISNLILKYLTDSYLRNGVSDTLKHVIIFENSHYISSNFFSQSPNMNFLDDIPLLLKGSGVSLVSITSKNDISHELHLNFGVKIMFKMPFGKDIHYNFLNKKQHEYLRNLQKREAIVLIPNFNSPFRIITDYFEFRSSIPTYEILASSDNGINQYLKEQRKVEFIDFRDSYNNIQQVLNSGPQPKEILLEKLLISETEIDELLKPLFKNNELIKYLKPDFFTKKKKEIYCLPQHKSWLRKEVQIKLENDFLKFGLIGKLPEKDIFDYLFYENNEFIKIYWDAEDELNLQKFNRCLFFWLENIAQRNGSALIIIVPFHNWAESIRGLLNTYSFDRVQVFSYYIDDWQTLKSYLRNTSSLKSTPSTV